MRNFVVSVVASAVITCLGIFIYHKFTVPKIAFVKTGVILQKYIGMQEANKQFSSEIAIVQSNSDTLRRRIENLKFEMLKGGGDKSSLKSELEIAEREFYQYSENADKQLQQRQQQLTSETINRINSYIEEYGKNNGYRIIFGTTNDGSILYGEEADDLTETILSSLNESYSKTFYK